jgi:MFS family permease
VTDARRSFAGIIVAAATGYLSVGSTIAVLPIEVRDTLHGSDLAVGLVLGAVPIAMLLTRPFAGRLIDVRGPRGVLIGALLVAAVAGATYPFATSVATMLPARFLHGTSEAAVFTAGLVWAVGLAGPDRRGRVIGLFGVCVWAGFSMGPPVGQLLYDRWGANAVWAFAAVVPLVGALIGSRLTAPPRAVHVGRRTLLPRGAVVPGVGGGLAGIGIASITTFVVLLCRDRGFGGGSWAIAVFAGSTLLLRVVAGGIPDRIGPHRSFLLSVALGTAGQLVIAGGQSWLVVAIGCALFGACWTLLFPALSMLVVAAVPETERGAGLAAFSSFLDAGTGIGAPILGLVAGAAGYGAVFAVGGAVVASSAAVVLTGTSRRRHRPVYPSP